MSVRIDGNLLLEILEETPSTQNIMLMGKHGIGKSQILEKFYTAKGCKVVTGEGMLVHQGIESFRKWFPEETKNKMNDELAQIMRKGMQG